MPREVKTTTSRHKPDTADFPVAQEHVLFSCRENRQLSCFWATGSAGEQRPCEKQNREDRADKNPEALQPNGLAVETVLNHTEEECQPKRNKTQKNRIVADKENTHEAGQVQREQGYQTEVS